jgi:serine protease Do
VSGFLAASELPVIDGRPGQAWALEGASGQSLTIDLLSDAFDGYLYLAGPGLDVPLEDDDGGTDRNARITVTIPASGTFRVIVSAFSAGSGGAFDLRVTPN